MKSTLNNFTVLFIALYFSLSVNAQSLEFTMASVVGTPGSTISVPVTVNHFDAIVGFQFTMEWNLNELNYVGVSNFNLEFLDDGDFGVIGPAQGFLTCAWVTEDFSNINLDDNTQIFTIEFMVPCESSGMLPVIFTNDPTEIGALQAITPPLPTPIIPTTNNGAINAGNALTMVSTEIQAPCAGEENGCIQIEIDGGSPPYTYQWTSGGTTAQVCNLASDFYLCTITDNTGCSLISDVFFVPASEVVEFCNINVTYEINCDPTACIDISTCGGPLPNFYLWSNGDVTEDVCGLSPGIYYCTITDLNNCIHISPAIEVMETGGSDLMISNTIVTNAGCNSGGAIDISLQGGTTPFTYLWNNGSTTQDLMDVPAGDYTCVITENNGCTLMIGPISIGVEPNTLVLGAFDITDASCSELGAIDITITGGTSPYSYNWSNGTTSEDLADVAGGSYTCTITDDEGCQLITQNFEVNTIGSGISTISGTSTLISCNGAEDGSIDLVVEGSGTPFIYLWSNGAATEDLNGLPPGIYSCLVTDLNGCELTSMEFEITEPEILWLDDFNITDENGTAEDGSVGIIIIGGTADYTYNWSNGGTAATITNLSAGEYTCTVTDGNGCELTLGPFEVGQTIGIFEPANHTFSVSIWPNPASESFTISSTSGMKEIIIYNRLGQLIQKQVLNEMRFILQINIFELPQGLFLIQVFDQDGNSGVQKFTVVAK